MSKYKGIADANEEIIAAGRYTAPSGAIVELDRALAAACAGTVSYAPDGLDRLLADAKADAVAGSEPTQVEVTHDSSMTAAWRLHQEGAGRVAVLNFASARNAGGGYLGGARAQEEDLCRVSALYTTLRQAPDYYAAHRASKDPAYSHRVIYSPDVPVYRDVRYRLLEAPYQVSFLTSPAPNAGVIARDRTAGSTAVAELLAARAARVLAVAAHHGHRSLVLGAWGCGVFRNDPAHVAAAFQRNLAPGGAFAGTFERIVFAILDKTAGQPNLAAFRTAFGPAATQGPVTVEPCRSR
ncbi:TIGR02452 family protein [Actinospica robiniae]|uniref:TIGR02452 family protein n=1 Tax=Actinospica robiniae TaxID=304901 RepID=UPI000402C1CA|nr:TIGR02452 family protein [Actinospica robiniae]